MAGANEVLLASMKRMEDKLDELVEKVQCLEKDNVKNNGIEVTVQDHEKRLRELEKLAPAMRVVIWIAGALGLSVIGLIWGLITGQISLVMK